ncbi:tetratricopeptide repeat protein [Desulfopila aestuarii]|uniref:Uncharacterized protein n=1 Tax=Desulfopila aestuarii DSM 18488 TaxID=1121416 RepID=A0A1M7YJK9_9BACT|nr:hypothetical protein [Desulfopila aestuarii]SHO52794.1 hypothetical protein SAMN02745220_04766 [Desulfopila aestuarii DSM 18488]
MALEKEPSSPENLLCRGAAYLKLGQFDNAVKDLSKELHGGLDCEKASFLRGIAYLNASKFEQALIDLNQTLQISRRRCPGESVVFPLDISQ